jgi:hypothetical protein
VGTVDRDHPVRSGECERDRGIDRGEAEIERRTGKERQSQGQKEKIETGSNEGRKVSETR